MHAARTLGSALAAVTLLQVVGCAPPTATRAPGPRQATRGGPAVASAATPAPVRSVFGHSVRGRELLSLRLGSAHASRRLLLVGVIHGDETAGRALAVGLLRVPPSPDVEVIVVPDLNPDGVASGTRQNAHGVDLNRNFPYRWRRLGHPGDQQYSGTGPLSEPESRAMATLIRRMRPTITVWFHQPVGVVDESGGSVAIERRFAGLMGEPLKRLTRYPGSVASWQDTTFPGTTAFVVELPHVVTPTLSDRTHRALRDLEQ
ncbi:MAG: murein peptide amidase [Frankiales bacterium]|jgi:protein MpaA|nr:murein peptide amidase [Frankiales bacterium]